MLTRRMHYSAECDALTGTRAPSACVSCRQAAGCGSALLSRYHAAQAELAIPREQSMQSRDGEEYLVSLPEADLLRICAVVFPGLSVALLGGAWLGDRLFASWGDAAALAGGIGGLVVGALLLRLYDARLGSRGLDTRLVIVPSGRVSHSDS